MDDYKVIFTGSVGSIGAITFDICDESPQKALEGVQSVLIKLASDMSHFEVWKSEKVGGGNHVLDVR